MAIQNTSNLSNAITTRYTQRYQRAAAVKRLYDQLAVPIGAPQYQLEQRRGMGSTYTFNFASDMNPGTTAISESADITPQVLTDATSTVTPTSRGEAIKWSELLDLEAYTDFIALRAEKVGENAMETIETLAISAALGGSLVSRTGARNGLDAGTTADRWTEAAMWEASALTQALRCPPYMDKGRSMFFAIGHPDAYYDLFHGGNVVTAATYQNLGILLNGELGEIANFKLIISPWAKVFGSAGAANTTTLGADTLSAAATALDKTMSVTTGTNIGSGRLITVGTEETSTTFYPTNERVKLISGTTTAVIVGSGANGGLRFDHASGASVLNNDSVYPIAYGAPGSLVKIFANEVGAFGKLVGPKEDGVANQWQSLAWKFYGNYGRVGENYIVRGEYTSSLDA